MAAIREARLAVVLFPFDAKTGGGHRIERAGHVFCIHTDLELTVHQAAKLKRNAERTGDHEWTGLRPDQGQDAAVRGTPSQRERLGIEQRTPPD